jgi:hypothetical protein
LWESRNVDVVCCPRTLKLPCILYLMAWIRWYLPTYHMGVRVRIILRRGVSEIVVSDERVLVPVPT